MNQSPALSEAHCHALLSTHTAPDERASLLFRHSARDAWLVVAAIAQAILTAMTVPLVLFAGPRGALLAAAYLGVSLSWCSNTIAHNHLHNPLFRSRRLNAVFSLFLSALTGVPQALWRARHLAHHAGDARPRRRRPLGTRGAVEIGLIAASWIGLAIFAPSFLLFAYAPGYAFGMALSALQGHYEHEAEIGPPGAGVSHHGRLYNLLWFNDGYHVEHHRSPREHWTRLPERRLTEAVRVSAYPPLLRWLEWASSPRLSNRLEAGALGILERMVLRSDALQRFVISRHERAFAKLLPALEQRPLRRIGIVGGGLFPRSVIALRRLLPDASLVVLDQSAHNIALARSYLAARKEGDRGVEFVLARFDPRSCPDFDLLVTPLAFVGDKDALDTAANVAPLLVHDWIWRRRGDRFAIISVLLFKRLNLVLREKLS